MISGTIAASFFAKKMARRLVRIEIFSLLRVIGIDISFHRIFYRKIADILMQKNPHAVWNYVGMRPPGFEPGAS
ncbi:MAG: hypothetical protein OWR62_17030 [Sulfobacillus thermotolerans]|nr:hypothetical protein [Sulfobacillus thermotolerans]